MQHNTSSKHSTTQVVRTASGTFYACFSKYDISCHIETSCDEIFTKLELEMHQEKHLLHPNKEALMKSFFEGLGCVIIQKKETGNVVVGFCRLIPLTLHNGRLWYELGSVFISNDVRNHGVSTGMYEAFLVQHRDKLVLATTTNPAAIAVGKKMNFVIIPRRSLPESVWQASCTCDSAKTMSDSPLTCSLAHQERVSIQPCYFRVTKETNEILIRNKTDNI